MSSAVIQIAPKEDTDGSSHKRKRVEDGKESKQESEPVFTCSICLEVPKQPVLTCCSHSFCKDCITKHVEKQDTCPLCRAATGKVFTPNTPLAQVLETLYPHLATKIGRAKQEPLSFADQVTQCRLVAKQRLVSDIVDFLKERSMKAAQRAWSHFMIHTCPFFSKEDDHFNFFDDGAAKFVNDNNPFQVVVHKIQVGTETTKITNVEVKFVP